MKNDLEMYNSVLSRLESFEKQKKRKSIIVRRTAALTLGTAAVIGIVIFTHAMKPPNKPTPSQSGIIIETETTSAVTTAAPTSPSTTTPKTTATKQVTTTVVLTTATTSSAHQTTTTACTTATAARTTRRATITTVTSTAMTMQNATTTTVSTMTHGDLTVSTASFTGETTTVEPVTSTVSTNPPLNINKYVMITYEEIDLEAVSAEAEKRADEYVTELEEFGYTDEEIESMRQRYFDIQFSVIRKEWNKERAKSIINALGADPSKAAYAIFASTVQCELTDKQIEAAKSLQLITSIILQENNEQKAIWIKNNE